MRSPAVEHLPSHTSKDVAQSPSSGPTEVDEFSTMVWKFMNAAGHLVNDLDSEVGQLEIGRTRNQS